MGINECTLNLHFLICFQKNVFAEEDEQLVRQILTVECAALHCPREVNKRHFLVLQHAAFNPRVEWIDAPISSSQPQSQPTRKLPPNRFSL